MVARCWYRAFTSLAASAVLTVPFAAFAGTKPDTSEGCLQEKIEFDGIVPLKYAVVTGQKGDKVPLYRQHPGSCASSDSEACTAAAYVVPADDVAVGKKCDGWSYVQFIGKTRITTGWIKTESLDIRKTVLPFDDGRPSLIGDTEVFVPATIPMKIVRGKGIPVCEAYLQRLNQTVFHWAPYCGRPENDQIPGFERLQRVRLSPEEGLALYQQIKSLYVTGTASLGLGVKNPTAEKHYKYGQASKNWPDAWRLEPAIDLGNDGIPGNIIIWSGEPDGPAPSFPCGVAPGVGDYRETRESPGVQMRQTAYVTSDDYKSIDDSKTREFFAHPSAGMPASQASMSPARFFPTGDSVGFFKFRDQFYFDTFFQGDGWADFEGHREKLPDLRYHLAVLHREKNVTREVCEYLYDPDRSLVPILPAPQ